MRSVTPPKAAEPARAHRRSLGARLALAAALATASLACRRPAPSPSGADPGATRARVLEIVDQAVSAERAGQMQRASALRAVAATEAERAGLAFEATRQHLALVFANLYRERDLAAATRHLDAATGLAVGPEQHAQLAYFEGMLARERGDTGFALRTLARAADLARQAGAGRDAFAAATSRASLLAELGRFDEALVADAALDRDSARQGDCDRASFYSDYGWLEILAADAGRQSASLPHADALLAEALSLYRGHCPISPAWIAIVLCNQAFASLLAGHLDKAERQLAELGAMGASVSMHVELWRLELEARLAAARGQARASLAGYLRLAALAEATLAGEARWRALVGQGRALDALGRIRESIAAFERAEGLLDHALLGLPIGEGRAGLAALRDASAAGLAEGLLRLNRGRDAVDAVRRARSRVLRRLYRESQLALLPPDRRRAWDAAISRFLALRSRLDAGALHAWSMAAEHVGPAREQQAELSRQALRALQEATDALAAGTALATRPPTPGSAPRPAASPGELRLGYFPLRDGWLGFAEGPRALLVRRLGRLSWDGVAPRAGSGASPAAHDALASEQAQRLLDPFADLIAVATTVRVLPYGSLDEIDFHALPFRGRPLLAGRSVVYGLDLEPVGGGTSATATATATTPPPATATAPTRGLLVVDPAGNLPGARAEADTVLAAWSTAGVRSVALAGHAATRARLFDVLPQVDLFHYAGHGRVDGVEGIASELPLADGAALTLGDILALRHVPARAILAGCETARAAIRADAGLGLAQTFLLAGAREVVASVRPVDDSLALALAQRLNEVDAGSLHQALRRAQLALRDAQPGSDWSAFRVLVP